jgi:hypothetical protein
MPSLSVRSRSASIGKVEQREQASHQAARSFNGGVRQTRGVGTAHIDSVRRAVGARADRCRGRLCDRTQRFNARLLAPPLGLDSLSLNPETTSTPASTSGPGRDVPVGVRMPNACCPSRPYRPTPLVRRPPRPIVPAGAAPAASRHARCERSGVSRPPRHDRRSRVCQSMRANTTNHRHRGGVGAAPGAAAGSAIPVR